MAIKKKAGRISPVFMGDYDNTTVYRRLDWVYYGGTSYICKKSNTTGIAPSDIEKWQKIIELPTELDMIFEEAATRENIASGDKLSVVLGKIKKWYSDLKKVAFTGKFEDLVEKPGVVSKTENGFVQKGNGQANKVWKTDADGNPGWRDDANTQAVTSVNNKTGAITLSAKDVKAAPAGNRIEKLTDINEITSIGFWTISAIDPNYATSIGIDNNTGDFHALVLSYNGNGTNAFNFGTVILSSPRVSTYHYEIQVWEGAAQAIKTLNNKNILNTTEQISANTNNLNLAGALALKAVIADYTNKLNAINSNLSLTSAKFLPKSASSFGEISSDSPTDHSIHFFKVVYNGSDPDAPDTSNRAWWWNVFIFGPPNRQTQIAFCPFTNVNNIYMRQLHDDRKYGWYKISGTQV